MYLQSLLILVGVLWLQLAGSLRINDPRQDSQIETRPSTATSGLLPIAGRLLGDCDIVNLLVVSDIDGNLHGIDRTNGFIKWTLPIDEPLVQIRTQGNGSRDLILWFVEPYEDGLLYYFTPTFGLNKIPTLIKELVMALPFSLRDDNKIYTGLRRTLLYEVNIHTGETRALLGLHEQCPVPRTHYPIEPDQWNLEDTFMIGKTTFELTIADKDNAELVWNVTYSQWGPNNIDTDLMNQNQRSADNHHFYPFYDKILLAFNEREKWGCKLPGIAVAIFDIFHNEKTLEYVMLPHPQTPAPGDDHFARDKVFITKTSNNKEWIAMSYENYPSLIKTAEYSPYTLDLLKLHQGFPFDRERLMSFNLTLAPESEVESYVLGLHDCHLLLSATNYQPQLRFGADGHIKYIESGSALAVTTNPPNIIGGGIKFTSEEPLPVTPHSDDLIVAPHETKAIVPLEPISLTFSDALLAFSSTIIKRVFEDVVVLLILFVLIMTFGKLSKLFRLVRRAIDGTGSRRDSQHEIYLDVDKKDAELEEGPNDSPRSSPKQAPVDLDEKRVKINKHITTVTEEGVEEGEMPEEDDDSDPADGTPKRKRKRGSRGGKRGGRKVNKTTDDYAKIEEVVVSTTPLNEAAVRVPMVKRLQIENNLTISDKILGYGSHGTVVYQGTFEGRPVAVKRMLLDFYDVASHEVRLLQESDDHENVVRYFCLQTSKLEKFLYIALELCLCLLEDIVEKPNKHRQMVNNVNCTLYELASGLHHLHLLKIVHRDIKPQNILVSDRKKKSTSDEPPVRLLISDFGLCKKLDADQSSFRATTQHAALGTSGWRAPELLLNHDLVEILPDTISLVHLAKDDTAVPPATGKRLTKAIDIFSLGCVFFYILTGGAHPFGDRYLREANIVKGEYSLDQLAKTCPRDRFEAEHLIRQMIQANFLARPTTKDILAHPLFWTKDRRLQFLLEVSDRFEVEQREPPSELLSKLESHATSVLQNDWHRKFDKTFLDNLGKYRKYQPERLMDLLRAIRNKYRHFNDMPPQLQAKMTKPDGFYDYFITKFPNLLMEVYALVAESSLRNDREFHEYFEPL